MIRSEVFSGCAVHGAHDTFFQEPLCTPGTSKNGATSGELSSRTR